MKEILDMSKKTFTELLNDELAAKHNSDLQNLVAAKIALDNNRKQLENFYEAYIVELDETDTRLMAMIGDIENGKVQDVRDIKIIYNLAQRPNTKFSDFEILL